MARRTWLMRPDPKASPGRKAVWDDVRDFQEGSRLSVQPVQAAEWEIVVRMGGRNRQDGLTPRCRVP